MKGSGPGGAAKIKGKSGVAPTFSLPSVSALEAVAQRL